MTRDKAHKLRQLIVQASQSLDDKTASEGVELLPKMQYDGSLIKAGTKINWFGQAMKAGVDLWDTEPNNPDNAPAVWEKIMYKDGIRIIPETITVITLFSADELGWWIDGKLYRSKVDNNAYTPAQYPDNWELVQEATT